LPKSLGRLRRVARIKVAELEAFHRLSGTIWLSGLPSVIEDRTDEPVGGDDVEQIADEADNGLFGLARALATAADRREGEQHSAQAAMFGRQ
jgi:hypothetical protein